MKDKTLAAFLVVAIFALAAVSYRQWKLSAELEAKVQALEAARKEPPTLALQAQCSDHARKEFRELRFNANDVAGYANHYSAKYNKCFMEVWNTVKGRELKFRMSLTDVLEGRDYGTYIWHSSDANQLGEKPYMCYVEMPDGEKADCHSKNEFEDLANTYMRD